MAVGRKCATASAKAGGVRVQTEVPQGGLVVYQHPVRAPVGQFFRRGFYPVPQEQRVYRMPDLRGQLPGLASSSKVTGCSAPST